MFAPSHQGKGVQNEVLLDLEVQCAVCTEAGGVVHFQQPGAALVVQQDVIPQQLEAGKAFVIWWPYCPAGGPRRLAGFAGRQQCSEQKPTPGLLQAAHTQHITRTCHTAASSHASATSLRRCSGLPGLHGTGPHL